MKPAHWLWLVGVTVAAALPRVLGLRGMVLADGEAWHALIAGSRSASDVCALVLDHRPHAPLSWLGAVLHHDAHPPLFYLLLRGGMAAGLAPGPFALRFISLIPGLLCIPAFYLLGRTVGGVAGGMTLAWLAACSRAMVIASEEVRHYALLLLFTSLALRFFLTRRTWAYFLFAALTAQTHYASLVVIGVLGLVGVARSRRQLAWWCGFHLALAALVWCELRAGQHPAVRDTYVAEWLAGPTPRLFSSLSGAISGIHFGREAPLGWILLAPFAAGLFLLARRRSWELLAISLGPLLVAAGLDALRLYPLYGHAMRWSLWLVPTTVLPLGVAAGELAGWRLRVIAAAVLGLLVANEAWTPGGALWQPDRVRSDSSTFHWMPLAADEEKQALIAAQVSPQATLLVTWTDHLRDLLAERLGWTEYRYRRPYLAGDLDAALPALIRAHPLGQETWAVMRRPRDQAAFEREHACLIDRRLVVGQGYLLVGFDGQATRERDACR